MLYRKNKIESANETARIEAFSDGVFAIAITLLILEVKVPEGHELNAGLLHALLEKWPSYVAFFIGFFTILVCWINNHYMFNRIKVASHPLILANSFTLFAVSFVPYPTAVLAQAFSRGDLQTAVHFFGLGYVLMAVAYRTLSGFVYNEKYQETTPSEKKYRKAILTMYSLSIVHTTITYFVIFFSVFASLLLYILLFSMFLFPEGYTNLIIKYQEKRGK